MVCSAHAFCVILNVGGGIMEDTRSYMRGFLPYALAALLVGLVGGFVTVLGPAFVRDLGLPYNNTTWTALAMAMSTAACAPILGKLGDVIGRKRTLLLGIVVFTAGNALSAVAGSLLFMLLARTVTSWPRQATSQPSIRNISVMRRTSRISGT